MAERNAQFLQIGLGHIWQDFEIDGILGKGGRVLGKPNPIKPGFYLVIVAHCRVCPPKVLLHFPFKFTPHIALRPCRERPGDDRAAECGKQFPPSDGDCHTPLPCEVRKGNDTTPRACSLHIQRGQDAGCFDLCRGLRVQKRRHCSGAAGSRSAARARAMALAVERGKLGFPLSGVRARRPAIRATPRGPRRATSWSAPIPIQVECDDRNGARGEMSYVQYRGAIQMCRRCQTTIGGTSRVRRATNTAVPARVERCH